MNAENNYIYEAKQFGEGWWVVARETKHKKIEELKVVKVGHWIKNPADVARRIADTLTYYGYRIDNMQLI